MHIIKRWQAYGFNCLIGKICFAQTEWYNGYVVIPKDHPLYGRHREDPDLNLQGDMFFSEHESFYNGEAWYVASASFAWRSVGEVVEDTEQIAKQLKGLVSP